MAKDYVKLGYKEGDTFKDPDSGKTVILQPDGTVRDASIVTVPKPTDYVEPTPAPVAKTVTKTVENENPSNPGTTKYYSDGTSEFIPSSVNPQGLTKEQMIAKGNQAAPSVVNTTDIKYNPDGTRVLTGTEKELADYYNSLKPKTADEIKADEEAIRQRKLQQQNEAISGITTMYDNLLAQINEANKSRLGSAASINALSGQRGSASGAANETEVQNKNTSIVKANEAERNAKIAQVMSDYETKISDEILKARELRTKDADTWLTYKSQELERNKSNSADLRKSFIAAGLKPEDLTDKEYQEIATNGGYTLEQAKAIYKSEYDTNIKDAVNKEAERKAALEKTAAETEKLKAEANAKSQQNLLINKGYIYVSTPAERDALKAQGRITTEIGGKTYVVPANLKTKVITKGNMQVLIDMNTGEEIKTLGPKPAGAGSSDKNYTATTIPPALKKEILQNKAAGATIDEMMAAYADVSTQYLQSLYADPKQFNFGIN